MPRPQVDFEKVLAAQGVPVTANAVTALIESDVVAANSIISNNSAMSPFWKLFAACVVTPVLWLIKTLLAKHVLPAMFTATATELYLDLKAWDVGLERKPAVKTQGNVSFTKADINAEVVVKAGTKVLSDNSLGAIYTLLVLVDMQIPIGTKAATILCEAISAGAGHNLASGYYHVLPTPNDGIASVSNVGDWISRSGANKESDDALALRIRDQFSSVGNYHIDAVYRGAIATFAGMRSDLLYFEHNAPRGPGTANCHVMMDVGETPQSMIDGINNYINAQGYHGHGDDLLVKAMVSSPIDLTVDIWHQHNLSEQDINDLLIAIESRIRAAFRYSDNHKFITRTQPQSEFIFSLLSSELHAQLPQLKSIRWGNDDIISGLDLPRLNSLVITNKGAF